MKPLMRVVASVALLLPIAVGLYVSFRLLPPISQMPPDLGQGREGENWIGQGGWAFLAFTIVLLIAAYSIKRIIVMRCDSRPLAVYYFASFAALSLPYIWFLCEPDWFNPFIYRISCWVGGPIAFWFIPTLSFLLDLGLWNRPRPLKRYLLRLSWKS